MRVSLPAMVRCWAAFMGMGLSAQPVSALSSLLRLTQAPVSDGATESGGIELRLDNVSGKDIVAYAIDVSVVRADGSLTFEGTLATDLVPSLAAAAHPEYGSRGRYAHVGPLRPGGPMFQLLGGRSRNSSSTARIVTVRYVVFDDNTSAGDRAGIERVFSWHADAAESELQRLRAAGEGDVRTGLVKWKEDFVSRRGNQANGPARAEEPGRVWVHSLLGAAAAQLGRILELPDDRLAARHNEECLSLAEEVEALRQHSVMGRIIQ